MKTTLNVKAIEAAKPGSAACLDMFDAITPGLCLRVTAAKKSWCFVFTPPGATSRTRMGFGTYPATDLATARTKASELRGLVEAGKDPRHAATAAKAVKTIAQLIEERLAMKVRGKLRSAAQTEWRYAKYVTPLVGNVPVREFRIDPHYNRVIDPLVARGKLRMAGVIHVDLISLFDFAEKRDAVDHSPIRKAENPFKYVPCKRWLEAEEIATLWDKLPAALHRSPQIAQILRLLIVTGQRSSEVAGMARAELDMKARTWTIPAERSKNGHEHVVPLSALALRLIREAMRDTNGEYLFPDTAGEGPIRNYVISHLVGRALERIGIAYWTPHDLRRTVGTHLSKLGVSDGDIGQVLNHRSTTKSTVTQQVYNQNTYLAEKRAALDTWGGFLAKLVGMEELRAAA